MAIGDNSAEPALLLLVLANETFNATDPVTVPVSRPHTLWLQNLAISIEVVALALSLTACSLRAHIRIITKNLGWGMWTLLDLPRNFIPFSKSSRLFNFRNQAINTDMFCR